ncbi:DoxX family protein [Alistipes sp.]|uniref:DoxX family protein n=1 Tax=Alistipes sp. TaxID=1872444 RepID=UPI003AEF9274
MKNKIEAWLERYRCLDWAVLYMRLFIGGVLLFHNIGKMQTYNEIIDTYPSLPFLSNAAVFVIVSVAEVLFSVLLIMGLWVRMSALILALGMVLMFVWDRFGAGEAEFMWLGIYVFLVISGGGTYAFDRFAAATKEKK